MLIDMKKLNALLVENGINKRKLADELEVSRPTIHNWCKRFINRISILGVAKYFGVEVDDLKVEK
jgi:transposase